MKSHLIDGWCPLICHPVRWIVLGGGAKGSLVKQKATNKPRLPSPGDAVCGVWGRRQGQVDLIQAEPFISYAGAYVQCLGDPVKDAVD